MAVGIIPSRPREGPRGGAIAPGDAVPEGESSVKSFLKSCRQVACTATAAVRPLPDYLIIGGQRCGTTALHDYLARHPGIGEARVKEVHFFDLQFDRGARWYRGHFPNDARRALVRRRHGVKMRCGEATPYYVFHPLVPGRAHRMLPRARIIAVLRDPVSRALSHYHHEVALGAEPLSFEEALAREEERLAGEEERILADPTYTSFAHQHHSYGARGHYIDQLERWAALYGREQMLVLQSERFFSDTVAVVNRIIEFIGLPVVDTGAVYRRPGGRTYDQMQAQTRAMLRERFAEPNHRLEAFLGEPLGWD